MLVQKVQGLSDESEKQELGVQSVTKEQDLLNKDNNFIIASDVIVGCMYRTEKGLLVQAKGFNRETKKVIVIPVDTGSEVPVAYDYPLYLDLNNPLVLKRRKEFGEDEVKETTGDGEESYGFKKVRKRKETKTSCVDSLLREGKDLTEVVKTISSRYNEEEKKVKRLVWSRRALLKKENNG